MTGSRLRLAMSMALLVTAAAGMQAGAADALPAHATSSGISFYVDVANSIDGPNANTRLVRPSRIYLTEDGTVVLEGLRWGSWGGSVANARGMLSASNCNPNCAQGHRTNSPAQVALSSPGLELGHEVYRCFRVTVPSRPASDVHDCLKRAGALIVYEPVAGPRPKTTSVRFFTPSRNITCQMTDNGTAAAAACVMQKPQAIASLTAAGSVSICQHQGAKCTGNFGESSTPPRQLSYGQSVQVGRFRCMSAITGVTCVVMATGKGFFISKQAVRRIG